jgi:hypothetical protein
LWVLLPLAFLVVDLYYLAANEFESWPRHVLFALCLLAVSACGLYFLLAWPGATWVLRIVASLVSLYFLFWASAAADAGPGQPADWGNAALPLVMVAFGVFTVAIADRA